MKKENFFNFDDDTEKNIRPSVSHNNNNYEESENDPLDFADEMYSLMQESKIETIFLYVFEYKKGKKNTSKSYGMIEWSPDPVDFDSFHLPTLLKKRISNLQEGKYFVQAKNDSFKNIGSVVVDIVSDNKHSNNAIARYKNNDDDSCDFSSSDISSQMKRTIDRETVGLMSDVVQKAFKTLKDGVHNGSNAQVDKLQQELTEIKKALNNKEKELEEDKFLRLEKTMKEQVNQITDTYNKQLESLVQEIESQKLEGKKKNNKFDFKELLKTVGDLKPVLDMLNINPFNNQQQFNQPLIPQQKNTNNMDVSNPFGPPKNSMFKQDINDLFNPQKIKKTTTVGNIEEPDFSGINYIGRNNGGLKMNNENFKNFADSAVEEIMAIVAENSDDNNDELFRKAGDFFRENFLALAIESGFNKKQLIVDIVKNPDDFVDKIINNISRTMLMLVQKSIPDIKDRIKNMFKVSILEVVSNELKNNN